ncbi:DUF4253 domain-containing protein [Streptomyces sp. NPDC086182]|uniref:DUF4253 domain-containing protein n=1 Tax=Streptomyces sp. NPDC086182 TaxID=3155058 RepID=UPI003415FDC6
MATLPNPLPRLTADPSGHTLGLELPPGRLIDAGGDSHTLEEVGENDGWHEPLLWYAEDRAAPGSWAALAPARASGLLPVLVDVGGPQNGPENWELMPEEMSYAGDHDADEVLADFWEQYAADELDGDQEYASREVVESLFGKPAPYDATVAPYGPTWPGLAAATAPQTDPDTRAAEIADALTDPGSRLKEPRLALVPARRSADIPAVLGWAGPLNHENDVARLCSVLRSWEDRFGIRVVALTFDQLVVSVAAPPTTMAEAEAVAAEHFAFCPDNITQGHHTALREYAEQEVLNERVWSFWWD